MNASRNLRLGCASTLALALITAVVAAPQPMFRSFVAPSIVRESLKVSAPCAKILERLPPEKYLALSIDAPSIGAPKGGEQRPSSIVAWPWQEHGTPARTHESVPPPELHPYGWQISYTDRWFECEGGGQRLVCLRAPRGTLLFRPLDTPDYASIAHGDDNACACVSWRKVDDSCEIRVNPVPFVAKRTVPPNAMNLAHGQTEGWLPFVAFAPEHWMDALCHELARLGGAQASACVKSVTPNDTIFARWAF